MVALVLFIVLLVLSIPLMLIVALVKLSDIRSEIACLKTTLTRKAVVEAEPRLPSETVVPRVVVQPKPAEPADVEPPNPVVSVDIVPAKPTAPYEPTAIDLFWMRIEDWFCVRGQFAPKGMSREFAVATRWLVRIGMVLIVGSLVYFAKLSIDRGWMGPTGRVVSTLLWGAAGVAAGAFLVKRTQYGLIGHAVAALGVVALYFGFGLGHRFFDPPVIASPALAFTALFGVTVSRP